jgi:hypothetical protein
MLRNARYYVSMTKKHGFKVHLFCEKRYLIYKIYLSAYEGSMYYVYARLFACDDQVADSRNQLTSFHPYAMHNQFQV